MDQAHGPLAEKETSLHQKILADIEGRIISGDWAPGHRIPFEVDLARDYNCSRMTVNKVLTQLAKSGLIERRKRSGSFVRTPTSQSAVLEIRDIASEVAALGLVYRYRLVQRVRRKATADDRAKLDLGAGRPVLHLTCLHMAGADPFCLEDRLINLSAVPEAEEIGFDAEAPGVWLLRQVPWSAAEHVVRAVEASAETAERLRVRPGKACLVIERRTALNGAFVTNVTLTYPGDRHVLHASFAPAQSKVGG